MGKRTNGTMVKRYSSLRVGENTKRLAKELSAKQGMPMKDFVHVALEMSEDQNAKAFAQRKKTQRFGFELRI